MYCSEWKQNLKNMLSNEEIKQNYKQYTHLEEKKNVTRCSVSR